jgi:hypothetical protein
MVWVLRTEPTLMRSCGFIDLAGYEAQLPDLMPVHREKQNMSWYEVATSLPLYKAAVCLKRAKRHLRDPRAVGLERLRPCLMMACAF